MKRWLLFLFSFIFLISGCTTINIENSSPNVKKEVIQLEKKPKEETKAEVETKPKKNTETPTPSTPSTIPKTDSNTDSQRDPANTLLSFHNEIQCLFWILYPSNGCFFQGKHTKKPPDSKHSGGSLCTRAKMVPRLCG